MRGCVLIVDDDRETCEVLRVGLERRDFKAFWRTSAGQALELFGEENIDALVTDLNMPGLGGIEFSRRVKDSYPDVPVIVITAFGSLDTAVAAIRAGAYDFITKPFEIEELAIALDRAVQHRRLEQEVRLLRTVVTGPRPETDFIGDSAAIRKLEALIRRMADTEASVLLAGETGTGKELAAGTLHRLSRRCKGPFMAINCAAMPETLLESELFGYSKGAFTGADRERRGLLVQADGGTVLLDEIGSMPLGLQPKLLRALQEKRVRPLGASSETPFDARIIAATNCDLETAVEEGRFRSDLFYRINVIYIEVPPLRARGTDALILAQHFIGQFAGRSAKRVVGLTGAAAEKLRDYPWPGNVRELQNCIERAVAVTEYDLLAVSDLPEKIQNHRPSHLYLAGDDPTELVSMEEVERRYILKVLEAAGGNKTLAARILGFDRRTLYRKLEQIL